MRKKGMLLASETLKMVLAFISITFLIFLLVSLYFSNVTSQKSVQAEANMERIKDIFERSELANFTFEEMPAIGPPGWTVFIFTNEELKPNQCLGGNCVCICEDVWIEMFDRQIKECSENGFCEIRGNLKESENIEIGDADEFGGIKISKSENLLEVGEL